MTVSNSATKQVRFVDLGLHESIVRALVACGYETPTPIQARSIPVLLQGKDLLGIAQTGTGKTAAFSLPILHLLHARQKRPEPRRPRALVLAPTRELASQILESCRKYGNHLPLRHAVVYGGVGMTPQIQAMQKGVDVLIATPGRLLDLMQQRHVDLSHVEILVLDEADRMLDMGFIRDVEKILDRLPKQRHSLLFSATMPEDVARLARGHLRDPVRVEVTPPAATTDKVEQSVCFVEKSQKRDVLAVLLKDPQFVRTLVFTRTKHGADRVAKHLSKVGIEAMAIHGDKSQGQRERALQGFRDGRMPVLVATDLAARGIDVPEVTHVVNFELPNIPESYVHRIGRTARAGRGGIAISLCDGEEREYLRDIEKLIRKRVPVITIDDGGGMAAAAAGREPEDRQGSRAPQGERGSRGPRHGDRSREQPQKPAPRPQPAPTSKADWLEIARQLGAATEEGDEPRPHGDPFARPQPPAQKHAQKPAGRDAQRPQRHAPSSGGRPSGGNRSHGGGGGGGPKGPRSHGGGRPQGGGGQHPRSGGGGGGGGNRRRRGR